MDEKYRGRNHDWEDGEFLSEGRRYDHRCRRCGILCRMEGRGEKSFPVYNRTGHFDDCDLRIVGEVMTS
jgi:hypothetical protein